MTFSTCSAHPPPSRATLPARSFLRGEPEVCLVISHAKRLQINERENRRRAPEDALLVEYAGPETAGTNAPQTMRLWPGLRLVGAGGKVQKGVFVTVSEVGERVSLESGQSFEPRELLKHTRLCSAITYASVQGGAGFGSATWTLPISP